MKIQMPNEWIEIEPVSGRDSGQIILRYGKNDTSSGRSATVRIWNSDFKITATTVITQSICSSEITGITLNASWLNDVPASGGTATKDNCTYNVMGLLDDGNTRNVTNLSNVYGSLTVPSSTDVNRHSAGTLTLNAEYQNFTDSENVIVYQAGFQIPTGTTDGCDVEVVYNVTSTTRPTKLYNLRNDGSGVIDYFTIDDDPTQHEPTSTGYTFTFDTTGEHTVHFYLTGDTLGDSCFNSCTSLSSATIGTGVTSIGDDCFTFCTGLTSIDIPDSVTSLGNSCFWGCYSLSSITIPDSVTSLGSHCFIYCSSLSSIIIPDSVTSLGDYCFSNCTSLSSITIGTGVTSLSDYCFNVCTGLTSIDIPDWITSLGDGCFNGCSSLSSITIPDSVTSLGDSCLSTCYSLSSITIPDSVTSLGSYCFNNCDSLSSITIPDSVTSLSDYCFWGCTSLSSATIGTGVTSLSDGCFYSCYSLSSITIPDSVTSLGNSCFFYCGSLSSITIPDSVTTLGDICFSSCTSLSSITIPDSVTSLGSYCFSNCTSLSSIACLPTTPPTSGSNMFNTNCPIYVPDASVDAYKSAWSIYAGRIFPLSQKPSENEINDINVSSDIEWDTNISEQ